MPWLILHVNLPCWWSSLGSNDLFSNKCQKMVFFNYFKMTISLVSYNGFSNFKHENFSHKKYFKIQSSKIFLDFFYMCLDDFFSKKIKKKVTFSLILKASRVHIYQLYTILMHVKCSEFIVEKYKNMIKNNGIQKHLRKFSFLLKNPDFQRLHFRRW